VEIVKGMLRKREIKKIMAIGVIGKQQRKKGMQKKRIEEYNKT